MNYGQTIIFWVSQLVIHYQPKVIWYSSQTLLMVMTACSPHFGLVLPWEEWEHLANQLKKGGISFDIEPYIRFKGLVGEQATMFFRDPCNNALEFKAFKDIGLLFAK